MSRARHLDDLVALGSIPTHAAAFLDAAVSVALNALVAGSAQDGKPTWVAPEECCRRVFRRYAVALAQPSVLWKLPAGLVAGVLEPPSAREGYAGSAPPLSLSVVPGLHHGRHGPEGAGGRRKSGTPLALSGARILLAAL